MFTDLFNWIWDGPMWHLLLVCGLVGLSIGITGAWLSDHSEDGSRRQEVGEMLEEVGAPLAAALILPVALGLVVGGVYVAAWIVALILGLF